MYLYLVERTEGAYVDEVEGFVIAALSAEEARSTASKHSMDEGAVTWLGAEDIRVEQIGDSYLSAGAPVVILRAARAV